MSRHRGHSTEHNVEQGTDEWFELRLGRLTSSHAAKMLATKASSGEAAERRNLRVKMVLERLTGKIEQDAWTSRPMQRGTEMEPLAIAAYEAMTGSMVERIGFLAMDDARAGASPDGIVGEIGPESNGGVVEVKCPLAATHLGYLKSGEIPGNYMAQILHLLWVTGAEFVDWMSYHPDFPETLQTKLIRVPYNEGDVATYGAKALEFLGEVNVEEQLVREMAFGKVTE